MIAAFSGVRAPTTNEDFIIGPSEAANGFVNVAGMQSPGLASAPAVAEMVMEILQDLGVTSEPIPDFDPVRPTPLLFADLDRKGRERLIEEDSRHGHVVCRCEQVTEADVVNAIHGIVPATNTDAVKRRTRAGMGRCHGGFCGNRVAAIIARELGIPVTTVTKDGGESRLFAGETKRMLDGSPS